MSDTNQKQLGKTLWNIADQLRGAMNADDFRDYMLSFLFLRYLSDNYERAAERELGKDYPSESGVAAESVRVAAQRAHKAAPKKAKAKQNERDADASAADAIPIITPLQLWYARNPDDITEFEKQMRRKVHYVIQPAHLWNSIAEMARTQNGELLNTLQAGFKYIENESFESTFNGLFSEINLGSDKLGRKYEDRNAKLCSIIAEIAKGLAEFSSGINALGDAYIYLIGQFAAGSGKKAGEFYTPQQISDILSTIVSLDSQEPATGKRDRLASVLDFACGSAFLLHGFHFLKDEGVMAIILPHGVLFRGGAEERIRTKLLKDGHIDTVIGLPANLFYSTGIPVCILVLKKCKKPDDVLFINAAEHFVKGKRQNQLTEEHIARIIATYQFRKEEDRYSKRIGMERIAEEGYNLNISRYISTATAEEEIDLSATHRELVGIEQTIEKATARHNDFLRELGLSPLP